MNMKHRNQWKRIWAGMLGLVLVLSVTGCHWQKNGHNNNQVSDEFWQQVQEEIDKKSKVFSNKDNSYCITTRADGEETVNILTQQKLDGTLVQNHEVRHLESLIQVSDSYLYYLTEGGWGNFLGPMVCSDSKNRERRPVSLGEKRDFVKGCLGCSIYYRFLCDL